MNEQEFNDYKERCKGGIITWVKPDNEPVITRLNNYDTTNYNTIFGMVNLEISNYKTKTDILNDPLLKQKELENLIDYLQRWNLLILEESRKSNIY